MRKFPVNLFGLIICLWAFYPDETTAQVLSSGDHFRPDHADTLRLIAVGDINLGRKLGRIILKGDTTYPFAYVSDTLQKYDIVFANLESTISEQNGETENSEDNMVFTAPPAAAFTLKQGGVNLVSLANNHAFDYGASALKETIQLLDSLGINHAGARTDTVSSSQTAMVFIKGIRVALLACTEFMNGNPKNWPQYVCRCDTESLKLRIDSVRDSVDFIVVSVHGGNEYENGPSDRMAAFARVMLQSGADLVLGHHPHIAYGVESSDSGVVVHSLGNFIFLQPQYDWTQYSYAFTANIVKDSSATSLRDIRLLPVRCGFQPRFLKKGKKSAALFNRVDSLSVNFKCNP